MVPQKKHTSFKREWQAQATLSLLLFAISALWEIVCRDALRVRRNLSGTHSEKIVHAFKTSILSLYLNSFSLFLCLSLSWLLNFSFRRHLFRSSRNSSDIHCHDPFNPAMIAYSEKCQVPKQSKCSKSLFPIVSFFALTTKKGVNKRDLKPKLFSCSN